MKNGEGLQSFAETDERAQFIIDNEELYPDDVLKYVNDEDEFNYIYNYPFLKTATKLCPLPKRN